MAGTLGYNPKASMDNKIKDQVDKKQMLDDFRKHKENIENMADSSNYLSDIKSKVAADPNSFSYSGKTGKAAMKAARSDFIELNENNYKDSTSGNIFYKDNNGNWIDSGQSDYYVKSDGSSSTMN